MKNYCIEPADADIASRFHALWLVNEFLILGFKSRKAFVEIVTDQFEELKTYDGINRLNWFWAGREISMIPFVEKTLENLKQS